MVKKLKLILGGYFFLFYNIFGTKLYILIKNIVDYNPYKENVPIDILDLEKIEDKDNNIQEQIDYLIYMNKFQGFYKGLFDDKFFNKKLLVFFLDYITKDAKIKNCYIDAIDIRDEKNKILTELSKDYVKEIADKYIYLYLRERRVKYEVTKEGFDDDISSFIDDYSDYFDVSKLDIEQKCKLRLIQKAIIKNLYYYSEDFFGVKSLGFATVHDLRPSFLRRTLAGNPIVNVYVLPYFKENDNNNNIRPIKLTVGNSVYEIKINEYYKVKYFLTKKIFLSFFKDKPGDDIIKIIGNNIKCYEFSDSHAGYKLEENKYIRPEMTVKLSGINYDYFKKNDKVKNLYNKQDNSGIINFSELEEKFKEINEKREVLDIKYRILSDAKNVTNDDPNDKELPYTFLEFEQEIKSAMKPYVYIISKTKTKKDKKSSFIPIENIKMSHINKKNNAFDDYIKEEILNAKLNLNFKENNDVNNILEHKEEEIKKEDPKKEENREKPKKETKKVKKEILNKKNKKEKHKVEKIWKEDVKKPHIIHSTLVTTKKVLKDDNDKNKITDKTKGVIDNKSKKGKFKTIYTDNGKTIKNTGGSRCCCGNCCKGNKLT